MKVLCINNAEMSNLTQHRLYNVVHTIGDDTVVLVDDANQQAAYAMNRFIKADLGPEISPCGYNHTPNAETVEALKESRAMSAGDVDLSTVEILTGKRCVVRVKFQDSKTEFVYRYRGDEVIEGDYVIVPDRRERNGFKVSIALVTEVLSWDMDASVDVIERLDLAHYLRRGELEAKRDALLAEAKSRAKKRSEINELSKQLGVGDVPLLNEIRKLNEQLGD